MKSLSINLETKFTSKDLLRVLNSAWKKSFSEEYLQIKFDLTRLEWISNQEVMILISWIYRLIDYKKYVIIELQSNENILSSSRTYRRRKKCLSNLIFKSHLQTVFRNEANEEYIDKNGYRFVTIDYNGIRPDRRYLSNSQNDIIPFYKISAPKYSIRDTTNLFDIQQKTAFAKYPLELLLTQTFRNEGLNQIDNNSLSYVIPKELFTNVCQYAFDFATELSCNCYFSLGYESKIKDELSKDFLKARIEERALEEKSFFANSKNISFLTYSFVDYGKGIPETLRINYRKDSNNKTRWKKLKKYLHEDHENQDEETRIIEYAFLLFTSSNELSRNLEFHDFLPRGLYVIKDIVRRNKGLLIAQSYHGKIVYDFSKSQSDLKSILYYKKQNKEIEFPGTLITVIFPSNEIKLAQEKDHYKLQSRIHEPDIETFTLLKEIVTSMAEKGRNKPTQRNVLTNIFLKFTEKLHDANLKETKTLFLIDYSGIEIKSSDVAQKMLYYCSLTSLVNEKVNVIIFNIIDHKTLFTFKNIHSLKIDENKKVDHFKSITTTELAFLSKPIPCFLLDFYKILWIGVDEQDAELLNNLFFQNSFEYDTRSLEYLEGNYIQRDEFDQDNYIFRIINYQDLFKKIIAYHKETIDSEISGKGLEFEDLIYTDHKEHNYNKVLHEKKGVVYLATNGYYQTQFISFIEKIYKKEYRRFLATYLVFNFLNSIVSDDKVVSKILTVTLSSQMLGKEVKDIFDMIIDILPNQKSPHLIPLSNYFDFDQEEPFKEISPLDNILVVNDVISTGGLSLKIYKSLALSAINAHINCFLTIVDCRTESSNNELTNNEKKLLDQKIVSLTTLESKFSKDLPKNVDEIIWISPVINAPITMEKNKGEEINILFRLDEFLNKINIDEVLLMGHIKHNTIHHTYYIKAGKLFEQQKEKNYQLLVDLLNEIEQRIRRREHTFIANESHFTKYYFKKINAYVNNIEETVTRLSLQNSSPSSYQKLLITLNKTRRKIEETTNVVDNIIEQNKKIQLNDELRFVSPEIDIDFVFVPFLSNVSSIEEDIPSIFHRFVKNKLVEVYSIPRIMTPKGWRFTFPPKLLNNKIKNKKLFIIDDGSWSGDTLIQMIDTVCFYDVLEIFVLSIVARFDDYQREFLARIKQIKTLYRETQIHIYVGTHLHVPIFTEGSEGCVFVNEEKELLKLKGKSCPKPVRYYIELRLKHITAKSIFGFEQLNSPTQIPAEIDKKNILLIRNFIGKYEGFRLYRDDVNEIADKKNVLFKDLDSLLVVILHEPYLLNIVERLDNRGDVLSNLKTYLNAIIEGDTRNKWFSFKLSIVRSFYIIAYKDFLTAEWLLLLVSFCKGDENSLSFIAYGLFKVFGFEQPQNSRAAINSVVTLTRSVFDQIQIQLPGNDINRSEYEIFRKLVNKMTIMNFEENNSLNKSSIWLSNFYNKEYTEGVNHDSLTGDFYKFKTYIIDLLNGSKPAESPITFWENVIKPKLTNFIQHIYILKEFKLFDIGVFAELEDAKFQLFNEESDISLDSILDNFDVYFDGNIESMAEKKIFIFKNIDFILNNLLEPSGFIFDFLSSYGGDVNSILKEEFAYYNQELSDKKIEIEKPKNVNINSVAAIHSKLMHNVFSAFISNFHIYLELSKKLSYNIKIVNNYINLEFEQNQGFNRNFPGGLGLDRIENIIECYNGSFAINTENKNVTKFIFDFAIL